MVKTVALALVLATTLANASPPDDEVESAETTVDSGPAFNMFGFRMSAGALPLEGGRATVLSVGLAVEHPVFKKTRVFGEYEWLWLTWIDERAQDSVVIRPERHGNGHRGSFGLRREIKAKNLGRNVRMFIDGELGASAALANDNMAGMTFTPGGLVGVRAGYDVYTSEDDSPSRTFELEILVRALIVEHGAGVMSGIGLHWGN
jgi:hypothetical protein